MTIQNQKQDTCTTREAAQMLGVSLRTAQLWVERGVLQAWKTAGGHRRIMLDSVRHLVAARKNEAQPAPPAMKVLVVEDDPMTLSVYRAVTSQWELPVAFSFVDNAYEGLLHIGSERPHLLVTDLMMPGMDGFAMIRTLRAAPETRDMTIIVLTSLQATDLAVRDELPTDIHVLFKPVRFDLLKELVRMKLLTMAAAAA